MSKYGLAVVALGAALLGCGAAAAAPGTLSVVVAGEAYDGPPRFEVTFDGRKVGEGTVANAIDTGSAGRFVDAADKAAYQQSFAFTIPEAGFSPDGKVRVRFLNEAFGGEGSGRDRNLYIRSVAVNGEAVPAGDITLQKAGSLVPSPILAGYLVLFDGTTTAIAEPPEGGWPAAAGGAAAEGPMAAAQPMQAPAAEVAPEAPKPVEVAATAPVAAPAAPAPQPAEKPVAADPTTTASIGSAAPADNGAGCTLDQIYNVIGFNENSNDLTPRLMERLDQILGDIGSNSCKVQVVGYSSTVGDHATNALFAVERAQNVLAYLRAHGLQMAKATATGAGATEQFGTEPGKNRRVVITVTP